MWNTSSRIGYNKNDKENQREKLQSIYGGEIDNHRIQKLKWKIKKKKELNYFELSTYWCIPFEKHEKEL